MDALEINVPGTMNVLEAARHTPTLRALVVVTTDAGCSYRVADNLDISHRIMRDTFWTAEFFGVCW